jgi:parallel beta-helix repeat protein
MGHMGVFKPALKWAVTVSVMVLALVACTGKSIADSKSSSPGLPSSGDGASQALRTARICGQPILNSPYSYNGAAGKYRSGTAGLPTYGKPGSDFPHDTAGVVLAAGKQGYMSYQLSPDTVYYLLPGKHVGFFQADKNDAFVGGLTGGTHTILSGEYSGYPWAIDSNFSDGDQTGVTIEYLTIEKFQPNGDAAAINQSSNTKWTLQYNTITLNVPGAGLIAGADNMLKHNCLTLNGQYGFQSTDVGPWGNDSLTGGPYDVTVTDNEISYNATCDFEGLFSNPAIGWSRYNPVPEQYRNSHCGTVSGDGNQGGFKLWGTNGVTIEGNYIHNNWGPGIWSDTNNANTTYDGNTITYNDGQAIIEEISYNFSITNNYLAHNGWAVGLSNPGFPTPAIYVSESGSDTTFGGIPACRETSCAQQGSYPNQSIISRNTLVDNGGSVLLWQNSDRFCSAEVDKVCTLISGGRAGPFTLAGCKANLPSASTDTRTFVSKRTGTPPLDWWNGCLWKTANISVTGNTIDFNPANIAHCNQADWPDCGAGGIFSEYSAASPYNSPAGWVILSQLTFFQHNDWADNRYNGPSTFYAWNQGNGDNPVSWAAWTTNTSAGDKCGSPDEHQSGACSGPFGQDAGSTYTTTPPR